MSPRRAVHAASTASTVAPPVVAARNAYNITWRFTGFTHNPENRYVVLLGPNALDHNVPEACKITGGDPRFADQLCRMSMMGIKTGPTAPGFCPSDAGASSEAEVRHRLEEQVAALQLELRSLKAA